uniref:Alpha-galactosidase n=1 Tax=Acrobeloides nanus TaxID=290746 RepID=A0A914EDI6_9BILA
MGFMTWAMRFFNSGCFPQADQGVQRGQAYGTASCVNETTLRQIADLFVSEGYRDAGYNIILLEDGWAESQRSADGKLVANRTLFPSGIPALSQYIHDRGLKFGIYSDVGTNMCSGAPGSWQHEEVDAQIANQDTFIPLSGPGYWNDPDVLIGGTPQISLNQARAHLAIWAIWSAPFIMSNNILDLPPGTKEVFLNKYVIAVDQDPLGIMGRMVSKVKFL